MPYHSKTGSESEKDLEGFAPKPNHPLKRVELNFDLPAAREKNRISSPVKRSFMENGVWGLVSGGKVGAAPRGLSGDILGQSPSGSYYFFRRSNMEAILMKAVGFLCMIALGFLLKRGGLFSQEDSGVLSKLVLKITLPMSIVSNFRALELTQEYLIAIGIGFLVHIVAIALVLLVTRKMPASKRAFYIINTSGYNIGLCTLPYMSGFFAADAVALLCMFDVGNAIMCFGITYAIAMLVARGREGIHGRDILKTLFSSMPFVTYLVMILLCFWHLQLPDAVYTIAGMIGQANAFLAMFLIGLLFEPKINRAELRDMAGVFGLRMLLGISFALGIYFLLPLPLMYRQILAIIVFSPILSVAPIYTERCGYNRSVAAVLNSLMLPFSMIVMTLLLLLLQVY